MAPARLPEILAVHLAPHLGRELAVEATVTEIPRMPAPEARPYAVSPARQGSEGSNQPRRTRRTLLWAWARVWVGLEAIFVRLWPHLACWVAIDRCSPSSCCKRRRTASPIDPAQDLGEQGTWHRDLGQRQHDVAQTRSASTPCACTPTRSAPEAPTGASSTSFKRESCCPRMSAPGLDFGPSEPGLTTTGIRVRPDIPPPFDRFWTAERTCPRRASIGWSCAGFRMPGRSRT